MLVDQCSISKDFPQRGLAPALLFLRSVPLVLPIKYFSKQTNKQTKIPQMSRL